MREAIQNVAVGPDRGRDITRDMAKQVMQAILVGEIDEVQIAVFFIALRMKRESMPEFQGVFEAMQASVKPSTAEVDELICLADPFDGYVRTTTMTPFIAPVLAACGLPALIHGVETVGPKHGVTAHKVYAMAGMDPAQEADRVALKLADLGCAYLDQSVYAPQLFSLQSLRDRIVKRTALTTLERLLVPITAKRKTHLVLGYVHKAYPEIYATVAEQAGFDSILLLKGVEGGLAPALNKPLRRFYFETPLLDDINQQKELLELQTLFDSKVSAQRMDKQDHPVEECLEVGLKTLAGDSGTARDSLCLAAGQILFAHIHDFSITQAVEKVQFCLDNGSAKAKFEAMIAAGS